MLENIKNFFTSFFSNKQQNSDNSENSTATRNSFCSTSATQEEDNEIKPIINEGSFKKNNFHDKELIKDILNSEKNKSKTTKDIKESIIGRNCETRSIRTTKDIKESIIGGNYKTKKISKADLYKTRFESDTKKQDYNYRT